MGFSVLLNSLRKMTKFVLASVHGKVVGGGVGLVSACDYAFATDAATIKLSELSIGLGPYVIEPAVSRKIGSTAFAQLSLDSAHWKSAQWGLEKGLYAECVGDRKTLDQTVNEKAIRLASYAPEACRALRKLHWKNTQNWENLLPENAKITARLALSDFSQNKIKSL
jgi:methylglutaconyl-CoA hydratase